MPPNIDKDFICFEELIADTHSIRIFKARMTLVDHQVLGALQPFLDALIRAPHDSVLALFDFLHVDSNRAFDRHAILGGAPGDMRCTGACDQRLRRDATGVDAGAAEALALNDRHLHSCTCQANRKRRPRLPSAYDDRVINSCHRSAPSQSSVLDARQSASVFCFGTREHAYPI